MKKVLAIAAAVGIVFLLMATYYVAQVNQVNADQQAILNNTLYAWQHPAVRVPSTNRSGEATIGTTVSLVVVLGKPSERSANFTWIAQEAKSGHDWVPDCISWCWSGVKYYQDPTVHITNNGIEFLQCKIHGQSTGITCVSHPTDDNASWISVSASGGYTPLFTDSACHATEETTNGFSIVAATQSDGAASGGSDVSTLQHTWTGATNPTASIDLACLTTENGAGSHRILYAMGQIGSTTVNVGDTLATIWAITYSSS